MPAPSSSRKATYHVTVGSYAQHVYVVKAKDAKEAEAIVQEAIDNRPALAPFSIKETGPVRFFDHQIDGVTRASDA